MGSSSRLRTVFRRAQKNKSIFSRKSTKNRITKRMGFRKNDLKSAKSTAFGKVAPNNWISATTNSNVFRRCFSQLFQSSLIQSFVFRIAYLLKTSNIIDHRWHDDNLDCPVFFQTISFDILYTEILNTILIEPIHSRRQQCE